MNISYCNIGWESFIGFQCCYCETILTNDNLTIDHVIPKSCGLKFGDLSNNTIPCCKDCNKEKVINLY